MAKARAPGRVGIAAVKATFTVRIDSFEPEFGVTTVSYAIELAWNSGVCSMRLSQAGNYSR